jgi:hypothetical protein
MNNRRKKFSKDDKINKKIIRCKNKMLIVFETDTCDKFLKNENNDANKVCKNCINSF